MVLGLRFRGPRTFNQTTVDLYIDAREPDCASTGPYFDENECEIGKETTFETNHCICKGNPQDHGCRAAHFGLRMSFCLKKNGMSCTATLFRTLCYCSHHYSSFRSCRMLIGKRSLQD